MCGISFDVFCFDFFVGQMFFDEGVYLFVVNVGDDGGFQFQLCCVDGNVGWVVVDGVGEVYCIFEMCIDLLVINVDGGVVDGDDVEFSFGFEVGGKVWYLIFYILFFLVVRLVVVDEI